MATPRLFFARSATQHDHSDQHDHYHDFHFFELKDSNSTLSFVKTNEKRKSFQLSRPNSMGPLSFFFSNIRVGIFLIQYDLLQYVPIRFKCHGLFDQIFTSATLGTQRLTCDFPTLLTVRKDFRCHYGSFFHSDSTIKTL